MTQGHKSTPAEHVPVLMKMHDGDFDKIYAWFYLICFHFKGDIIYKECLQSREFAIPRFVLWTPDDLYETFPQYPGFVTPKKIVNTHFSTGPGFFDLSGSPPNPLK